MSERSNPWNAHPIVPLLLAAGLAAVVLGWRAPWRDRGQQVLLAFLAALAAWQAAVSLGSERAIPAGAWRTFERSAMLGVSASALAGAADAATFLRHATAMATAVCGLVVLAWAWQGVPSPHSVNTAFGFGGINVVLTMAVPALIAGAAWQWARWRLGRPMVQSQITLSAVGAGLVAIIAVVLQRRSPTAVLAVVLAGAAVGWGWRRARVPTAAATLVALGCLVAWLSWRSTDPEWLAGRGLRLWIYLAGARLAWEGFPWGWGDYGALQLQWSGDPRAHWLTQIEWYLHLHNELLDSAANGGVVAVVLLVAIAVLVWRRATACTDPALAAAARALLVAVAVHGATDNSYSQPAGVLWIAAVLGFVLVLPVRAAPPWRAPGPRWFVFAVGPIAAWGALQAVPMAMLAADAPLAVHRRAHARLLHPETVRGEVLRLWPQTPAPMMRGHVESALTRLGPSAELPWVHVLALRGGGSTDPDAQVALRSLVTFLSAHPFVPEAYRELDEMLERSPGLATLVSPVILRRRAWIGGADHIPTDAGTPPEATVDALADDWARAVWHIRRDESPTQLRPLARRLAAAPIRIAEVDRLIETIAPFVDTRASGAAPALALDDRWPRLRAGPSRTSP